MDWLQSFCLTFDMGIVLKKEICTSVTIETANRRRTARQVELYLFPGRMIELIRGMLKTGNSTFIK